MNLVALETCVTALWTTPVFRGGDYTAVCCSVALDETERGGSGSRGGKGCAYGWAAGKYILLRVPGCCESCVCLGAAMFLRQCLVSYFYFRRYVGAKHDVRSRRVTCEERPI
jgi:hypothetical protein